MIKTTPNPENLTIRRIICHRLSLLVFATLFFSVAYFGHSESGWNVNSRIALTLAWAETGSPVLDNYVARPELETGDLSEFNGHFYSDKSIGTSLLGVPAALAIVSLENACHWHITPHMRLYLITLFSVGLLAAASGVLLMWWLAGVEASPSSLSATNSPTPKPAHAFIALGATLGSLLFLYGTLFMSYLPAHFFLLAALLISQSAGRSSYPTTVIRVAFTAGLCAGLSILCEYTYAAAAGFIGLYTIYRAAERPYKLSGNWHIAALQTAPFYALGIIIPLLILWFYTYKIFGEFAIPYRYHINPRFRLYMSQGFMGAGIPNPAALWLITFHPFRGLFVYSPQLLLGLIGLIIAFTRSSSRAVAALCLTCVVFYFLFNSAYYMWWGGWSFAPRHLAPAVPFLAAGLLPWLCRAWGRVAVLTTSLCGIIVHTLVNATEPQSPDGGWQAALLQPDLTRFHYPGVFEQHIWPRLQAPQLDRNLGLAAGLRGWVSLLPLITVWALAVILIVGCAPKNPKFVRESKNS